MRRVISRKRAARLGRLTESEKNDYHHSVYVILLDDAVRKNRWAQRLNPNRDPSKPCVYVGMTGLPVEHRFENHRNGYKSAQVVKRYGVGLLPEDRKSTRLNSSHVE